MARKSARSCWFRLDTARIVCCHPTGVRVASFRLLLAARLRVAGRNGLVRREILFLPAFFAPVLERATPVRANAAFLAGRFFDDFLLAFVFFLDDFLADFFALRAVDFLAVFFFAVFTRLRFCFVVFFAARCLPDCRVDCFLVFLAAFFLLADVLRVVLFLPATFRTVFFLAVFLTGRFRAIFLRRVFLAVFFLVPAFLIARFLLTCLRAAIAHLPSWNYCILNSIYAIVCTENPDALPEMRKDSGIKPPYAHANSSTV